MSLDFEYTIATRNAYNIGDRNSVTINARKYPNPPPPVAEYNP
jgi:hypothetical protein